MASWKDIVRNVAPGIAAAFGGPAAGLATRALAGALLGKPTATDAEIEAAVVGATAADLLKLKEADQQFAKDMEAFAVERDRLEGVDRESARAREIATKDWVTRLLALTIVALFALSLILLLLVGVPEHNRDIANQMVGVLYGAVMTVLAYYFGTSFGSRSKDATIAKSLEKAQE